MSKGQSLEKRTLRTFGVLVGGVFSVIGLWPLVFHAGPLRQWALVPGAVLIFLALFLPRALALPYRGWMRIGHVLGWFNTRVILGLIFFLIFTPMGLLMRLFGYDPMSRRFDSSCETYRVVAERRDPKHMENQF